MNPLEKAKEVLEETQAAFVAVLSDGTLYVSDKRGIAPIMECLAGEKNLLRGASAADKVIGRAAAFLLQKAGVKEIYGEVISGYGRQALENSGIFCEFGKEVPYIINRDGTGMCPMEETVLEIFDAEEAYIALKAKGESLRKKA